MARVSSTVIEVDSKYEEFKSQNGLQAKERYDAYALMYNLGMYVPERVKYID
jgi:hypothetical protein